VPVVELKTAFQKCACGCYVVPPRELSPSRAEWVEELFRQDWGLEAPFGYEKTPRVFDEVEALTKVKTRGLEHATKHGYVITDDDLEPNLPEVARKEIYILEEKIGIWKHYKIRIKPLECLVEGSEAEGFIKLKCPKCGRVTFEWRKPR